MRSAMSSLARRTCLAIALLATAGTVVSAISLYHHHQTDKTSYCDVGENFNCDIVNRSSYSIVLGVPVALIGILGYLLLLALGTLYRTKAETPAMLLIASLAGLGFALYLTYIEGFVLGAWCILCLSSLVLILAITVLSSALVAHNLRHSSAPGAV
jgi:vitamin-K-epoxide reductase (warfarin-sensitive)